MRGTISPRGRIHEAHDFGIRQNRYGWWFTKQTRCGKPVHDDDFTPSKGAVTCKSCLTCKPEYWP